MMMPLPRTDGRQAWPKGLILRIILGGVCLLAVWNTLHRQTVTSVLTDEQIRAIRGGYCPDLRQHPDIFGCFPSPTRILLITDIPALLPAEVGDIRVQTKPPPPHLPAPPGVIVVRAEGPDHRPELSECPSGYREARKYRWRFCLSGGVPIPTSLMTPPIAGIPYTEAEAIFHRHDFMDVPGVSSVGLGAAGITVRTTQPELIPSSVEGLPVHIEDPTGPFFHGIKMPRPRRMKAGKGTSTFFLGVDMYGYSHDGAAPAK